MLAASITGWAQETPGGERTLEQVTVRERAETPEGKDALQTKKTSIGKGTQDIRDIPQSISVVTEKLLDDKRIDTLNEALRLTAGVTFSAAENGTMQDTFIRGFSVAQVGDLLIDGMKDPSLYERETFNLDRIEVMRGSASMIFGRGSTGGVVNQVNKKPMLIDQHDVEFSAGTDGYYRLTGDFNLKTGEDAALRLNVMRTDAENRGAEVDKYGIAPSFRWGIGTRDEFNVGLYHLKYDNTPKSGMPYRTLTSIVDARDFYGAASDFSKGDATYASFQHTHRFDNRGELRTQVRTGTFDRSISSTQNGLPGLAASSPITPGTVVSRGGLTPRKDTYKATYFQSDYSSTVQWLDRKHELLMGVDGAHEQADKNDAPRTARPNTTIGTPNDGLGITISPAYRPTVDYSSTSFGAYLQDMVEVVPDWKVVGGLRVDSIRGDFAGTNYGGGVTTRTSASISDTVLSHRIGVLYQPSPSASYHASYGTSFNTSADTYQFAGAQAAVDLASNTPPEKSKNFEIGAKLDWLDGKLSTRAAWFRTVKYNERTTDADFAGDAYLLSGERHSSGLELEVVGRPASQWEIYVSYAYIPITKIDKAGTTAQATVGQKFGLVPAHSGSIWATYQPTAQLRLGLGMTGSSENFSISGTSPARGARAPGYGVVDALVEYRFTPDTYLQLNVSNIHNKLYAAELYRGFYVAGAGRSAKLTVGTRF